MAQLASSEACYIAADVKGPGNLVSCTGSTGATCCYLGDLCMNGNACYEYAKGNTYQIGCADSTYSSSACPFKCGWDVSLSPWVGLQYCGPPITTSGIPAPNTWTCFAPETCACTWPSPSSDFAKLPFQQCSDLGADARVAIYGPGDLKAYASLPASIGQPISSIAAPIDYGSQPTQIVKIFSQFAASSSTSSSSSSTTSTSSRSSSSSSVRSVASLLSSSSSSSTTTSIVPSPTFAQESGSSLSTGAKAGIGVGVGGLALIAIAGVVAWLVMRRRRGAVESDLTGADMPEKGTHSWAAQSSMSERRY